MSSRAIPVEVEAYTEMSVCDPISLYKFAVTASGKENVFILESLSGPVRDRKATIIGMDPIFNILIYDGYAELSGNESLVSRLLMNIMDNGFSVREGNQVVLPDNESVWNILRVIRNNFLLPHSRRTSLAYFGYISYDAIRFVEKIPALTENTLDLPVIAFSVFQTLIYFNIDGSTDMLISNSTYWKNKTMDDYSHLFVSEEFIDENIQYPDNFNMLDTVSKDKYLKWVDKALHHINIGDIYQIQLGHELHIETSITPFDVYLSLRASNPSPYMYLYHVAGIELIGASPELFVRLSDDLIEMRPIAGTVGKKPGVDVEQLVLSMTRSEKERAEHIMLVDLCRNDIARVCQPGSLDVDELMIVEEYSHLHHMVSNVQGVRRSGVDAFDVIKAAFPAGTMTGAPKVRAMELIEETELNRRGIYAGAVGMIGFDDSINTALCIRSAVYRNGTYYLRASAGVVADSEPEKEWMETFYKMSSVYRAVTGKELIQ